MEDSYSYNINMLDQSDFENVEQMQYENFEGEGSLNFIFYLLVKFIDL
jgi:hypothetical protein